jgi:spore coat polysaccharide biosynthesis protein SpsF (cytidylyltransferase family)
VATNVLGILQARMSSSRLPGKVLKPILGRPMLQHQIDRVRRAASLEALVVATSTDPSDDAIAALCEDVPVACFRGSLSDVLDRFHQAATLYQAQTIVRLTGDCPLVDPAVVDATVELFHSGTYAMTRTADSFADGLDVEVVAFETLDEAWRCASRPSDREHVTLYIHRQPDVFRIAEYPSRTDLSGLRLSVDEPSDFELVRRIYEALYPRNPAFATDDIVALLAAQPELRELNRGIPRNQGLQRSDRTQS